MSLLGISLLHRTASRPSHPTCMPHVHPNTAHSLSRSSHIHSIERIRARATESPSNEAIETEALTTTSPINDASLASRYQGYRSIPLDGCEFFIESSPADELVLANTNYIDPVTGEFKKATLHGDIPDRPCHYHEAEWFAEYGGNDLIGEEEQIWILKLYFISLASKDPYTLDFENVFLLDAHERSLTRLPVERLAPPDTPDEFLRIRLRGMQVTIDDLRGLPDPEVVVQSHLLGVPAMSDLEKERDANRDDGNKNDVDGESGSGTSERSARGESNRESSGLPGTAAGSAAGGEGDVVGGTADGRQQDNDDDDGGNTTAEDDILYDDDTLKDFLVEVDDDAEMDYDEYDMPASDY